jgi:hypothetical protein
MKRRKGMAHDWAARTAEAVRILEEMIEDRMFERYENEEGADCIRSICPKMWRPKPWDKKYTTLKRKAQMAWDRAKNKQIRETMERLDHALDECLPKYPEGGWERVFVLGCLFIRARDVLADIGPEAWYERREVERVVATLRQNALHLALKKPSTEWFAHLLFNEGAWLSEEQFEEEIAALEHKIIEERRPLEATIVRSLTKDDLAKLNA